MATLAEPAPQTARSDERFFLIAAVVMMAIIFIGFSTQLAAGRSTFARPLYVHAHALVFMGWVVLYVLQNVLVSRGSMALHRTLGWIGVVWIAAMIVLGTAVTVAMVQRGAVPFFFTPLNFLIFDPMTVYTFAGLSWTAVVMRRQTDWHRRLHMCGMAMLLSPALGRLLPVPFLIPYAYEASFAPGLIFPVAGMIADWRRTGRVHPAWFWGLGAMIGALGVIELLSHSAIGDALYGFVTAGTPGAAVAPRAFPPFPGS